MNQQLYINGILMDVEEDLQVTLVYKSNLFNDVDKISTNTSKTISLPITNNNLAAIGYAGYSGVESTYPYTTHNAEYYRNGMKILQGKAILLSLGEKIEISLMWGAGDTLGTFLKSKKKINELASDAVLRYSNSNTIDKMVDAKARGYFWAYFDPVRKKSQDEEYWKSVNIFQSVDYDGKVQDERVQEWDIQYKQPTNATTMAYGSPSAGAAWVKSLIEDEMGVALQYPKDCEEYISTLAMPCVNNEATELSGSEYLQAAVEYTPLIKDRLATLAIEKSSEYFVNAGIGAKIDTLTIKSGCTLDIDVDLLVKVNIGVRGDEPSVINLPTPTIFINDKEYTIGSDQKYGYDNGSIIVNNIPSWSADKYGNLYFNLKGKGRFDFSENDTIKIGCQYGDDYTAHIEYGKFIASYAGGGEVTIGKGFPIVHNLPDVGVVDFVKFLCFITGTFARQTSNDGLTFAKNTILTDSITNGLAVDWTRRLVTIDGTTFTDDEMAQVNHYKWKEDDYVTGSHDGVVRVENKTLEQERDAYTMPFSATDGDNIPLMEYGEDASEEPSFNKGEPKILTAYNLFNGNIALRFDIDVQKILDEKHPLLSSQNRFQQLEVTVRMNDLDLLEYDETRAVYLAQKGAYYAVKELTAESNGMAKAKLIKL